MKLVFGDGYISLQREGISALVTAKILGMTLGGDGTPSSFVLDRLIHLPGESMLDGWAVSGAVVSELDRLPNPELTGVTPILGGKVQ